MSKKLHSRDGVSVVDTSQRHVVNGEIFGISICLEADGNTD